MTTTVKVAVVGSGLAGLTAAHLLSARTGFEVHIFEKASSLGMDSSSVSICDDWRVDVPMRSFQGGYYPQLIALYKRIGVAFREADFSYSFSLLSSEQRITAGMIYNGASGRKGVSMPSAMDPTATKDPPAIRAASRAFAYGLFVLSTLQLLVNYAWLLLLVLPFTRPKHLPEMTFAEWAEYAVPGGVLARWTGLDDSWRMFVHRILVPLFSAVCTAPDVDVLNHPAEEFLDYVWLTLGTHHYTVSNGVRDVAARLSANIHHVHLSSPVSALRPDPTAPGLVSVECNGGKTHAGFAHVVLATQASHAAPLLAAYASALPDASAHRRAVEEQASCLRRFAYRQTVVVNHTDEALMPDAPCDRRDLNLISLDPPSSSSAPTNPNCVPPSYTMATHVLPHRAHLTVYQTTNPIIPPRQERILSVARLERAVLTLDAKRALKGLHVARQRRWWQCPAEAPSALGPLQGAGHAGPGVWIVGSYAFGGIPLLEGCVASARNVVEQGILPREGISNPW